MSSNAVISSLHTTLVQRDGKAHAYRGFHQPIGVHHYSACPADCRACSLRNQPTGEHSRALCRIEDEDARDLARAEMRTCLFKRSMRLRRGVERLFADAKVKHGMARRHLRDLRGAEEVFLVSAAVLNLLLLARPIAACR